MVYTLNPYRESTDLVMLHKKPENLGFYANPQYPLANKKNIVESDLENIPLLLTSHECSFRAMVIESLAKASITPKIVLETSSKEILKQFAINQLGVAFMPDMAAHRAIKNHSLKKLSWKGKDFSIFSQNTVLLGCFLYQEIGCGYIFAIKIKIFFGCFCTIIIEQSNRRKRDG